MRACLRAPTRTRILAWLFSVRKRQRCKKSSTCTRKYGLQGLLMLPHGILQRQLCSFGSSRHCLTCERGRNIRWPKKVSSPKQLFTLSRTCTLSTYCKLCTAAALQIYGSFKVSIAKSLPVPPCELFLLGIWACAVSRAVDCGAHHRQLLRPAARETAVRTSKMFAVNEQQQCSRTLN